MWGVEGGYEPYMCNIFSHNARGTDGGEEVGEEEFF